MESTTQSQSQPKMHVTFSRDVLQSQLTKAQPFVARKATIPILSNVLLTAAGEELTITATDLDCSLTAGCAAKVQGEGKITVPCRSLLETLKKLAKVEGMPEDVSIRELDGNWVKLSCGAFGVKMAGMAATNFPMLPKMPDAGRIPLESEVLATLIGKTMHAIAEEESRYTLNGALFEVTPELVRMVATDGHRLVKMERWGTYGAGGIKVIIPRAALEHVARLAKLTGGNVEFAVEDVDPERTHATMLFFRFGSDVMTARKLTGQFPDYERVLPKDTHTNVATIRDTKALASAVALVAQFADERSRATRWEFGPDGLRLSASSTESGSALQTVAAEYAGDPMVTGLNADYVLDLLKTVNGGGVTIRLRDTQSSVLWAPLDVGAYSQVEVVMSMRI